MTENEKEQLRMRSDKTCHNFTDNDITTEAIYPSVLIGYNGSWIFTVERCFRLKTPFETDVCTSSNLFVDVQYVSGNKLAIFLIKPGNFYSFQGNMIKPWSCWFTIVPPV